MGWVDSFLGKTVAVDTSPLIFYIEDHPQYAEYLEPFFQAVEKDDIRVVTSTVTLLEVLVHPLRKGDEKLAHLYNDFLLSSSNVLTVPVTPSLAQIAAEIRSTLNLKTPDAIQIATALKHHAVAFLTNDRDFGKFDSLEILRVTELT